MCGGIENVNVQFGREEIARVMSEVLGPEIGQNLRKKAKEVSGKTSMKWEEEIDIASRRLLVTV